MKEMLLRASKDEISEDIYEVQYFDSSSCAIDSNTLSIVNNRIKDMKN
jgi:hypothetical protein